VLFGSGEGAPYFSDDADTAQDAEIRERLSALPVATFPLGGGASDLAAALTDYSRVGHACTSPGATYRAERRVAITNLGTDVGPVSFGLGFGEHDGENVRIDRVVTIDLYRGLQPGESLEIGPLWGVKVVIDPEGSLGEPNTGNNTVSVPSETLVCS
jgi:hypothetical protein